MNVSFSLGMSVLVGLVVLPLQRTASAQAPSPRTYSQFGHASNWRTFVIGDMQPESTLRWTIEIGGGRSQVVGDAETVYCASGSSDADAEIAVTSVTTNVLAVRARDGEQRWKYRLESVLRGDQQTFGGADATPRSTPLLIGDALVVLTFTGQLICLDRATGAERWTQDLVQQCGAVPVQFGFATSPIADPLNVGRFVVLAGGERGGLLSVDVADGSIHWKCDCKTTSYATPTLAHFGGVPQWIVVNEGFLMGIDVSDGQLLWTHPLAEAGLTNVPTPLVVDESRLLVSGQGSQGTRCLNIQCPDNDWSVKEQWHQERIEFFYTNWMILNSSVAIGCTENFLAALDVTDGSILGRWRGYGDGNLTRVGDQIQLIGGKGKQTCFRVAQDRASEPINSLELRETFQSQLPSGRFWTPPSTIADSSYIRAGTQLHAVRWVSNDGPRSEASTMDEPIVLTMKRGPVAKPMSEDAVTAIFRTFESEGQQAALALYANERASGRLDVAQRLELAEAAKAQSMKSLAEMILGHAGEDFPDSARVRKAIQDLQP